MDTTVVNIRFEEYDVYIGRAGKGQSGYYGNPFSTGNREKDIESYRSYFYNRMKNDKEFLTRILQLKGKRLGCFCKPHKSCHGDVIAEYLNTIHKSIMLGVIGSREFNDYAYLSKILSWYDIKEIVSGGANGADSLAAKYANEHDIPLKEFLPDWAKYGKPAAYVRNKLIVENSDEIIAFWNQASRGTEMCIKLAEELGKPVSIFWPDENENLDEFLKTAGL
jgi:hypothetical protein